jgi:hypothetical protein
MKSEDPAIKEGTPVEILGTPSASQEVHVQTPADTPVVNVEAKDDKFLFCISIHKKAESTCWNMVPLKAAVFFILVIYIIGGILSIMFEIFAREENERMRKLHKFSHIVAVIVMVAAALGIYALRKKNSRILKMFYIMAFINFVAGTIVIVMSEHGTTFKVIHTLVRIPVSLYFLYMLYSYYYHLANGNIILADNGREVVKIIEQAKANADVPVVKGVAISS